MNNKIRYIAYFKVEANTPIAIGAGKKGITVDRLMIKDVNQLPYIPGTSLSGVVRHEAEKKLEKSHLDEIFGFQTKEDGKGSKLIFSDAVLLAIDNKTALEGLQDIDINQGYYSYFNRLPNRDHVKITDKGTAKKHGKFDEELVHKGTRFVFEIEMIGNVEDRGNWNTIINILHQSSTRFGAGTRNGFGQLKVIECKTIEYDVEKNLLEYLGESSSLNKSHQHWKDFEPIKENNKNLIHYNIKLKARDFFHIGSGLMDNEVDSTPKTEKFFDWSSGEPKLTEEKILIPATSLKGALSHRTAYYYNQLTGVTIYKNEPALAEIDLDQYKNVLVHEQGYSSKILANKNISDTLQKIMNRNLDKESEDNLKQLLTELEEMKLNLQTSSGDSHAELIDNLIVNEEERLEKEIRKITANKPGIGELNVAVAQLFGKAKNSSLNEKGQRGRAIFSDIYLETYNEANTKIFDHVAIDRFTGGAIDGALYQEKVVSSEEFSFDIYVENEAFEDENIKYAFENALEDLKSGKLPLGGQVGKGHGIFEGSFEQKY